MPSSLMINTTEKLGLKPLLIWFVFLVLAGSICRAQPFALKYLSIKDGLSQASVTCFEQDAEGFIWVGTRDGLNRFDGYNFAVLRHELNDSSSISSNFITDIETDDKGNLWVGTNFGLNVYSKEKSKIKTYYHWLEDSTSISSNNIRCIEKDLSGHLWVGTSNGLNVLNSEGEILKTYTIAKDDPSSLSSNSVNDIAFDLAGNAWVATDGGLNLLNIQTDTIIRYSRPFDKTYTIGDNQMLSVTASESGLIWVGTRTGLDLFDPKDASFQPINILEYMNASTPVEVRSISEERNGFIWIGTPLGLAKVSNQGVLERKLAAYPAPEPGQKNNISATFIDKSGLLWIGSVTSGISTLSEKLPVFRNLTIPVGQEITPASNEVLSMTKDSGKTLWIGTELGLQTASNDDNGNLTLNTKIKPITAFDNLSVTCLIETDTNIWIGTRDSGLVNLDLRTYDYERIMYGIDNLSGLSSNKINDILLDEKGVLWIATNGGGLCKYDLKIDSIRSFKFEGAQVNNLRDNNVTCLEAGRDNKIWVGTANGGVFLLNCQTEEFRPYSSRTDEGNISSNSINDLFLNEEGDLWVATSGGGICVKKVDSESFINYSTEQGLINDVVLALAGDGKDLIWMSTNTGVSSFDIANTKFKNYLDFQLAGDNTFNRNSLLIDSSGIAMFGGANGISYLDISSIEANLFEPPIIITGYQLLGSENNEEINQLTTVSNDSIILEYNNSGFEIEFAALNYLNPEENQYRYRLKGLFDRWRPANDSRKATFSNLSPGSYVFEVLGSNNDGLWSVEPAQLFVRVRPAFWQTLWFQIISGLLVLGILLLIYRYRISMETIRRHELERAVVLRTSEIAKERDTNATLLQEIHHRVKNNLQIIVSLLNLQSRFISNPTLLNTFSEIQNRVRSMSLIHQKMYQTEGLKSVNIEEYIRDLSGSLVRTYRLSNKIDLDVNVEVNSFNSDTLTPLGLIINEVISNALKYAFQEDRTGKISVSLKKKDASKFELIIGDDGVGVEKDILEKEGESFGTELICTLVEQLNGTIELLDTEVGTYYRIYFEDLA